MPTIRTYEVTEERMVVVSATTPSAAVALAAHALDPNRIPPPGDTGPVSQEGGRILRAPQTKAIHAEEK